MKFDKKIFSLVFIVLYNMSNASFAGPPKVAYLRGVGGENYWNGNVKVIGNGSENINSEKLPDEKFDIVVINGHGDAANRGTESESAYFPSLLDKEEFLIDGLVKIQEKMKPKQYQIYGCHQGALVQDLKRMASKFPDGTTFLIRSSSKYSVNAAETNAVLKRNLDNLANSQHEINAEDLFIKSILEDAETYNFIKIQNGEAFTFKGTAPKIVPPNSKTEDILENHFRNINSKQKVKKSENAVLVSTGEESSNSDYHRLLKELEGKLSTKRDEIYGNESSKADKMLEYRKSWIIPAVTRGDISRVYAALNATPPIPVEKIAHAFVFALALAEDSKNGNRYDKIADLLWEKSQNYVLDHLFELALKKAALSQNGKIVQHLLEKRKVELSKLNLSPEAFEFAKIIQDKIQAKRDSLLAKAPIKPNAEIKPNVEIKQVPLQEDISQVQRALKDDSPAVLEDLIIKKGLTQEELQAFLSTPIKRHEEVRGNELWTPLHWAVRENIPNMALFLAKHTSVDNLVSVATGLDELGSHDSIATKKLRNKVQEVRSERAKYKTYYPLHHDVVQIQRALVEDSPAILGQLMSQRKFTKEELEALLSTRIERREGVRKNLLWTPLHWAVRENIPKMALFLAKHTSLDNLLSVYGGLEEIGDSQSLSTRILRERLGDIVVERTSNASLNSKKMEEPCDQKNPDLISDQIQSVMKETLNVASKPAPGNR